MSPDEELAFEAFLAGQIGTRAPRPSGSHQKPSGGAAIGGPPCIFFMQGRCNRGPSCHFSHVPAPVAEVAPPPPMQYQAPDLPICKYWRQGSCRFGAQCRFSHQ